MDKITLDRIYKLHPKILHKVLSIVEEVNKILPEGQFMRVTQGLRTFEEQQALYNQGRTTEGNKVTNAKAGYSYHNYGLAFDYVVIQKNGLPLWTVNLNIVAICKKYGFEWGGNFKSIKDYPHFQMTFGYSEAKLLQKYNNKEFIPGTTYINI